MMQSSTSVSKSMPHSSLTSVCGMFRMVTFSTSTSRASWRWMAAVPQGAPPPLVDNGIPQHCTGHALKKQAGQGYVRDVVIVQIQPLPKHVPKLVFPRDGTVAAHVIAPIQADASPRPINLAVGNPEIGEHPLAVHGGGSFPVTQMPREKPTRSGER